MNEKIIKRLAALMSVKSIVTLALTGVFAFMACTNQISQDFMTIYAVIIAFYFGTQSQRLMKRSRRTQTRSNFSYNHSSLTLDERSMR